MKKSSYPAYWDDLAEQTKNLARWRCVRCGHPHESPKERIPCDAQCDLTRHIEIASVAVLLRESETPGIGIYRLPDGLWRNQRQRVLTVHHLDGDKGNSAWWNLAALCQVCHLQIQGKVTMEQIYALEHSEWFKPYVAGYYAKTYQDRHLTREEVMAELDELLSLERQV